ncbi:MAG: DUF1428 domain-containing protein [Thiolinea sp.]
MTYGHEKIKCLSSDDLKENFDELLFRFCAGGTQRQQTGLYRSCAKGLAVFQKWGALRMVESWGVDVPDGEQTDFKRAVKAQADESVVFSWIEWPDKETADNSWEKMQNDPEMEKMMDMPFDGMRMIWGGFEPVVDERAGS